MGVLADVLGVLPPQNGRYMAYAEALFDACHAGQNLLGHDKSIGYFLGIAEAQIAGIAVIAFMNLPEIANQGAMTANGPAAVAVHVVEMLESARQVRFVPGFLGRLRQH